MRRIIYQFLLLAVLLNGTPAQALERPKLVVGIVVDQMREDFLFRFYNQYGEDGFKRLVKHGFVCRNVHYNYVPTITAVGHTSLWSGTTPKFHGIVGNSWYDRQTKKVVYCVDDSTEKIVGNDVPGTTIGVSTRRLLTTNLADELKICTNQKGKVISVSIKDRAAALSSGHMADGVYWLDLNTGNFVSSTFFTQRLPDWLVAFNSRKLAYQYIDQTWKLLLPADQYPFSLEDDNHYEEIMGGKTHPAFPYDLKEMASKNVPYFEVLNRSPWGNTLIADLAIEALKQEKLGKDNIPDLLQISFSSTDAVGHTYGPLSMEINDTYLRLDRDLARLLKALDNQVGKGNYVVFLVADHGLGEVPQYLEDHNIPAGDFKVEQLRASLTAYLDDELGKGNWVECIRNEMVYLNQTLIRQRKLELTDVQNLVARFIKPMDGVAQVYTAVQLDEQEYTQKFSANVQNGFNYKRCGDVKYVFEPGWYSDLTTCATHSAQYNADSHVPLVFFGACIPKGESFNDHSITDLAPTVSMLLDIKMPNACIGSAIAELLNRIHR
ncbi:MAG: alkaline phosphatase family protein [Bacteroidota bacterium]|nr:alkaline phosphatase family protein [Bacteroidota bacterium]